MATPTPRGNIRFVAVGRKSDGASGAIVVASTGEQFAAFIKAETVKWAKVVKAAGIVPE